MTLKDNVAAVAEVIKAVSSDPNFKAAGQELGKTLHTAARLVNNALLPIAVVNFGFDKARAYFEERFASDMEPKVNALPLETLTAPRASIAGPALQALAFAHEEPDLKEMYLNLLTREMSSETQASNHPGFVEIMRQLTAAEARVFSIFVQKVEVLEIASQAGWWSVRPDQLDELLEQAEWSVKPELLVAVLENWVRLGLCRVDTDLESVRLQVENFIEREALHGLVIRTPLARDTEKLYLMLTQYGRQFAQAAGITE